MLGNFGFEFFNFNPQLIFNLIQEVGKIDLKEMASVFNLGWGFAIIVDKRDAEEIISMLKKEKVYAEIIGKVIKERKMSINYQNKKIIF